MPGMYAEAVPLIGAVRIVMDVSDFFDIAIVDEVQLYRANVPFGPTYFDDAVKVRVRPWYVIGQTFPQFGYPWEMLSGGQTVWYDTEVPLDTPVYYVAELPNGDVSFGEAVAAVRLVDEQFATGITGWTADTGATIAANTTTPILGERSLRVTATGGTATIGARSALTAAATVTPGRRYEVSFLVRGSHAETDVRVGVDFHTSAGAFAGTDFTAALTLPAGVTVRRRAVFEAPATSGRVKVRVYWGGTPTAAHFLDVDDVRVIDMGDMENAPGTGVTLASAGGGWLSGPELPAGDVRLDLIPTEACEVAPTPSGVIFLSNATEQRASAGGRFDVLDQAAPHVITARRKLPTSTLSVAALTFAERDAVHALVAEGNVGMLRLPAEFGVSDRYLDVGDVGTSPMVADLRIPYRVIDLPYAEASSPANPIAGVLGTRIQDLDRYATWADFDAANLTSIDLLLGAGSTLGIGAW
jgi:hypothetical protein